MSGLRSPYRKNGSCWDEGLCCSLDLMHNGGPWLSCAFRSTSGNLLGSKGRWRKSQGHHGGLDAQKVQWYPWWECATRNRWCKERIKRFLESCVTWLLGGMQCMQCMTHQEKNKLNTLTKLTLVLRPAEAGKTTGDVGAKTLALVFFELSLHRKWWIPSRKWTCLRWWWWPWRRRHVNHVTQS